MGSHCCLPEDDRAAILLRGAIRLRNIMVGHGMVKRFLRIFKHNDSKQLTKQSSTKNPTEK